MTEHTAPLAPPGTAVDLVAGTLAGMPPVSTYDPTTIGSHVSSSSDQQDPATPAPLAVGLVEPDAELAREILRSEAVEQLMRMCSSEDLILGLLTTAGSDGCAAIVGHILSQARLHLAPGCPLLGYGTGREVDDSWRRWCPTLPGSLFDELVFLRSLVGGDPAHPVGEHEDSFAELEHLRATVGFPIT